MKKSILLIITLFMVTRVFAQNAYSPEMFSLRWEFYHILPHHARGFVPLFSTFFSIYHLVPSFPLVFIFFS